MAGTPKPSRRIVTPARGRWAPDAARAAAQRLGLVLKRLVQRQLVEDVRVVRNAALTGRKNRDRLHDAGGRRRGCDEGGGGQQPR